MLMGCFLGTASISDCFVIPAKAGIHFLLRYQLALRKPGTSPRMVASRNLLRPRPNFAYTARGRPVKAQRVRSRDGLESRGSFCSLAAAATYAS
jgi:hypothetical protein